MSLLRLKGESTINKQGFTLIELLVVIAIIGILATIVVAGVSNYLARARDAKRIADIEEIKNALITYYADNAKYPEPTGTGIDCWSTWESGSVINDPNDTFIQVLVTEGYLDHLPIETNPTGGKGASPGPLTNNKCTYRYITKICTDSSKYAVLFANLETDAGQKDFRPSGFDPSGVCGGVSGWIESDPADPAADKRDWAVFLVE